MLLQRKVACLGNGRVGRAQNPELSYTRDIKRLFRHKGSLNRLRNVEVRSRVVREVLSPQDRTTLDAEEDRMFYSIPRLVHHSDDSFRKKVTKLYEDLIPANSDVLDLCSSWTSHLPEHVTYHKVTGHGMNAVELGRNSRLDAFYVRDFNKEPGDWAISSESLDAVLCCCSIQYIRYPEQVFAEIARVLKPKGICIVTFTNRMFFQKAISAWRENSEYGRVLLVKKYFTAIEGFAAPEEVTGVQIDDTSLLDTMQSLFNSAFRGGYQDPFYAVVCYKA